MSIKIDKLISGGLVTNYDCSANCAHCRHKASPYRTKGFITEEITARILSKLENLGCQSLHIEGGEPFLYPEHLIKTVKQINKSKITLEHIVTNCSWYKNQKDALKLLQKLQDHGLRRLVLKVGPFQNAFIPLKKVKQVQQTASLLGIQAMVWDNEIYPDVAAFDETKTHPISKYIKTYGSGFMEKVADCQNVNFAGRSFNAYEKHLPKYTIADLMRQNQGCDLDFPTATHFHVDLLGNFIFSHTNGVTIHIDDLGQDLDPRKYPYLHVLMLGGIESFYQLARQKFHFTAKQEYLSKCHLCFDIRTFLVKNNAVQSPDLQPLEFYTME